MLNGSIGSIADTLLDILASRHDIACSFCNVSPGLVVGLDALFSFPPRFLAPILTGEEGGVSNAVAGHWVNYEEQQKSNYMTEVLKLQVGFSWFPALFPAGHTIVLGA